MYASVCIAQGIALVMKMIITQREDKKRLLTRPAGCRLSGCSTGSHWLAGSQSPPIGRRQTPRWALSSLETFGSG